MEFHVIYSIKLFIVVSIVSSRDRWHGLKKKYFGNIKSTHSIQNVSKAFTFSMLYSRYFVLQINSNEWHLKCISLATATSHIHFVPLYGSRVLLSFYVNQTNKNAYYTALCTCNYIQFNENKTKNIHSNKVHKSVTRPFSRNISLTFRSVWARHSLYLERSVIFTTDCLCL